MTVNDFHLKDKSVFEKLLFDVHRGKTLSNGIKKDGILKKYATGIPSQLLRLIRETVHGDDTLLEAVLFSRDCSVIDQFIAHQADDIEELKN